MGRGGEGTNCLTDRVKLDQKGGEIFKYTFLSAGWDSGGELREKRAERRRWGERLAVAV